MCPFGQTTYSRTKLATKTPKVYKYLKALYKTDVLKVSTN